MQDRSHRRHDRGWFGRAISVACTIAVVVGLPLQSVAAATDTDLPSVIIREPTIGQILDPIATLRADIADSSGVTRAQFIIDREAFGPIFSQAPYQTTWDTSGAYSGVHTISVRATDASGNTIETPPYVIIVLHPYGAPQPPVIPTSTTPTSTEGTFRVHVTVTNDNGGGLTAAGVNVRVDGKAIARDTSITEPVGTHTLTVAPITQYTSNISGACQANGTFTITAETETTCTVTMDDNATSTTPPTPPPPTGDNLIPNPSFETGGDTPNGWNKGGYGTNTRTFTYPVPGSEGARAVQLTVNGYVNGDAKWYFNDVPVNGSDRLTYEESYQSNAPTDLVVRYLMTNGTYQYVSLGVVDVSADWTRLHRTFTVPSGATSLTIFHLLRQNGRLMIDATSLANETSTPPPPPPTQSRGAVSLNFDDGYTSAYTTVRPILQAKGMKATYYVISGAVGDGGYLSAEQVLQLSREGNEIGAHTRTHPSLPTLSPSEMQAEIAGSRQDLLQLGVPTVDTFDYPYGDYNDTVVQAVKDAGFKGARSVDLGFNDSSSDPFLLKDQHVVSTTPIADVKSWIDQADREGTWLILEMHDVVDGATQYAETPGTLQAITDYLAEKHMPVITTTEGLDLFR